MASPLPVRAGGGFKAAKARALPLLTTSPSPPTTHVRGTHAHGKAAYRPLPPRSPLALPQLLTPPHRPQDRTFSSRMNIWNLVFLLAVELVVASGRGGPASGRAMTTFALAAVVALAARAIATAGFDGR